MDGLSHAGIIFGARVVYIIVNSLVMASLCMVVDPTLSFIRLLKNILIKTILSVFIVFGFFALLARMFCWTALLGRCLECICPAFDLPTLFAQSTISATIMFFLGAVLTQAALIAIPRNLSPAAFISIVATSNVVASLIKLGMVSLLLTRFIG